MVAKLKGNGGCVETKNLRLLIESRNSLPMYTIRLATQVMSELHMCWYARRGVTAASDDLSYESEKREICEGFDASQGRGNR